MKKNVVLLLQCETHGNHRDQNMGPEMHSSGHFLLPYATFLEVNAPYAELLNKRHPPDPPKWCQSETPPTRGGPPPLPLVRHCLRYTEGTTIGQVQKRARCT